MSRKKLMTLTKKILDTSGLAKKTDYNVKITEIEGETPSITGLPTIVALNVFESKTPNVSSLV